MGALFQHTVMVSAQAQRGQASSVAVSMGMWSWFAAMGVTLAGWLKLRDLGRLRRQGYAREQAWAMIRGQIERPAPNWWILIGSLVFVLFTISIGLSEVPYNEEIIFTGSMLIVLFLMARLVRVLARQSVIGLTMVLRRMQKPIIVATPTSWKQ